MDNKIKPDNAGLKRDPDLFTIFNNQFHKGGSNNNQKPGSRCSGERRYKHISAVNRRQ